MQYHNLILFDGVCNLCNGAVNFIIDRDSKNVFRFTSLQSDIGQQILQENGLSTNHFNTFILVKNGKILQKSTAFLSVVNQLDGFWKLMNIFWLIPTFIRDFFYDIVSANRYRWFGKQESCRMPTPELKSKFL
jgi:predicted DCC family thiol-disulfide oxidoreductase YuxK